MHIDTKLEPTAHITNRNQVGITSVAYNTRRDEVVVCDGRSLRAYSARSSTHSSRAELVFPQKDMVGTHIFYNYVEN
eukprot:CAMPEP_0185542254 /NCGR_PEP_ID=MMETSP1381-20130426/2514_1 /TAXON_ID=298111 /ORGANISM="Pavlova sp., Strain CCMP459" /LENGTH=76 /DNA_ID=CAMNT_0028154237 /DNA_START=105 /DNA_END=332 /DNA_ORIENTATION=+